MKKFIVSASIFLFAGFYLFAADDPISFETTIFKYSGIFFDINGMYAGKYLGFMDLKSGIRVYPWHWTGIEFAYRHLLAKALWQGDGVETEFKGFNMSFILRF